MITPGRDTNPFHNVAQTVESRQSQDQTGDLEAIRKKSYELCQSNLLKSWQKISLTDQYLQYEKRSNNCPAALILHLLSNFKNSKLSDPRKIMVSVSLNADST